MTASAIVVIMISLTILGNFLTNSNQNSFKLDDSLSVSSKIHNKELSFKSIEFDESLNFSISIDKPRSDFQEIFFNTLNDLHKKLTKDNIFYD